MKTETKKTSSKAEQIKAIDRAWLFIGEALDNITHTKHGKKLYELNAQEERDYRRTYRDRKFGISVAFTAKLLSVQWLLKYIENNDCFTVADIIHCKASCAYAASVAANYPDKINAALKESGADLDTIRDANYCKLVK